jgi:hypothetical protein
MDLSVEASAGAISCILPYIMAAERWQARENKKDFIRNKYLLTSRK